jgi:hypothetical protein
VEQIYLAAKLRNALKRQRENGFFNAFASIVNWPAQTLRKLTIPPPDYDGYNRSLLSLLPLTSIFAFCFLMGIIGAPLQEVHKDK